MQARMQALPQRLLMTTLIFLLLHALGCGSCGETEGPEATSPSAAANLPATQPSEPAAPPPRFDRNLLVGSWSTSMEDASAGYRMNIDVTYTDTDFEIHGEFVPLDPSKAPDDLRSFAVKGSWTLEGETLTETPVESTFPLWRIGQASPATVKKLDEKTFVFERSGSLMTLVRDSSS